MGARMSVPPPPPGFVLDESTVPPPGFELDTNRSLKDRWRSAKADPRQRAALAREIGQDFARASYGPRYRDPNLASAAGIAGMVTSPAFLKTALDFAAFGLGSREVQKQARKTFPGMTVDE